MKLRHWIISQLSRLIVGRTVTFQLSWSLVCLCCISFLVIHLIDSLGSPPIFQLKKPPFSLARDLFPPPGFVHTSTVSEFPFLPLVVAVDHMRPDYDFSSLDIVTDLHSLRHLLRWIDGSDPDRPFRIDMQLAGDSTLLLHRNGEANGSHKFSGYGKNFVLNLTRKPEGCESQTSHVRVVSYVRLVFLCSLRRLTSGPT